MEEILVEGPYFEDLSVGDVFDRAPTVTLDAGRAAAHQAVVGGRLRLALDRGLSRRVAGGVLAPPALVWDVAIGQSTLVTHHVVANLFYRGLAFHRAPSIDDTLRTRTEIVALRQTSKRSTGLAALRITTVDQQNRPVLDFWRGALLPLRDPSLDTGLADDMESVGREADPVRASLLSQFDLSTFSAGSGFSTGSAFLAPAYALEPGQRFQVATGDVVTSAPELARLTMNIAAVHHDASTTAHRRRLVYGGHTIGLALAQLTRALPDIVTIAGWHGCDHLGPVHEGDTISSTVTVESVETVGPARLASLRIQSRTDDGQPVLDWRPVALV
jgi:acyl dehydratase